MNAEALKAKIRNISRDKDVDPQVLMPLYFMDQFLLRLSKYEEKDYIFASNIPFNDCINAIILLTDITMKSPINPEI